MRSLLRMTMALAIATALLSGVAQSTVVTLDPGAMDLTVNSITPDPNTWLYTISLKATNTTANVLPEVQFVWTFEWVDDADVAPQYQAMAWNDAAQRFEYNAKSWWVKPYVAANTYQLISDTDIPLSSDGGDPANFETATLLGTDMLPTAHLGDFAGGESKDFTFYLATSPNGMDLWNGGYFVAVPEPGSLMALASGLVGFAGIALRRRS